MKLLKLDYVLIYQGHADIESDSLVISLDDDIISS